MPRSTLLLLAVMTTILLVLQVTTTNAMLVKRMETMIIQAQQQQQLNNTIVCSNATDCTDDIQDALDHSDSNVVRFGPGVYITRPLFMRRSGVSIVFHPQTLLLAKRWCFNGTGDSLLGLHGVGDVKILGNGASMRMWRTDYNNPNWYRHAEWRMALSITDATNILVHNITLELSGGDGIYLGGGHNYNVTIQHVISRNNYRQGISVITAEGLLVEDSIFESTKGTAPQGGLDFEPDSPFQPITNTVFNRCIFRNNSGWQIYVSLHLYNASSTPVNISMISCVFEGGFAYGSVYVGLAVKNISNAPSSGIVTFKGCSIINSGRASSLGVFGKPASHTLLVEDMTIINNTVTQPPVIMNNRNVDPHNFIINNMLVYQSQKDDKQPLFLRDYVSWFNALGGTGVTSFSANPQYACSFDHGRFPVKCYGLG